MLDDDTIFGDTSNLLRETLMSLHKYPHILAEALSSLESSPNNRETSNLIETFTYSFFEDFSNTKALNPHHLKFIAALLEVIFN